MCEAVTSPRGGSCQRPVVTRPRSSRSRHIKALDRSLWDLPPLQLDNDIFCGTRIDPFASTSRPTPRPWSADPADGTASPLPNLAPVRLFRKHVVASQAEYESILNAKEADSDDLQTAPLVVGVRSVQQMSSSKSSQQDLLDAENEAAATIQAMFRRFLAQRDAKAKQGELHKMQHGKAASIQAVFRGNTSRLFTRMLLVNQRKASLLIQSVYRGMKERQRVAQLWLEGVDKGAAIRIQKNVRGVLVRSELRRQMTAVTRIQAMLRGRSSRQFTAILEAKREVQIASAVTIQSDWRGRQSRKSIRLQREHRAFRAAAKLQARFRGNLARRNLQAARMDQTCIDWLRSELLNNEGAEGGFDFQP